MVHFTPMLKICSKTIFVILRKWSMMPFPHLWHPNEEDDFTVIGTKKPSDYFHVSPALVTGFLLSGIGVFVT